MRIEFPNIIWILSIKRHSFLVLLAVVDPLLVLQGEGVPLVLDLFPLLLRVLGNRELVVELLKVKEILVSLVEEAESLPGTGTCLGLDLVEAVESPSDHHLPLLNFLLQLGVGRHLCGRLLL